MTTQLTIEEWFSEFQGVTPNACQTGGLVGFFALLRWRLISYGLPGNKLPTVTGNALPGDPFASRTTPMDNERWTTWCYKGLVVVCRQPSAVVWFGIDCITFPTGAHR